MIHATEDGHYAEYLPVHNPGTTRRSSRGLSFVAVQYQTEYGVHGISCATDVYDLSTLRADRYDSFDTTAPCCCSQPTDRVDNMPSSMPSVN